MQLYLAARKYTSGQMTREEYGSFTKKLLDEIGQVLTWPATHDQVVAASKLVPDDIVQMITASGTPDEVRAKVDEYVAGGEPPAPFYPLSEGYLTIVLAGDRDFPVDDVIRESLRLQQVYNVFLRYGWDLAFQRWRLLGNVR